MFSGCLDKQVKSGCSLDSIVISSYRKKLWATWDHLSAKATGIVRADHQHVWFSCLNRQTWLPYLPKQATTVLEMGEGLQAGSQPSVQSSVGLPYLLHYTCQHHKDVSDELSCLKWFWLSRFRQLKQDHKIDSQRNGSSNQIFVADCCLVTCK